MRILLIGIVLFLASSILKASGDYWTFIESLNKGRWHGAGSVIVSESESMVIDLGRSVYQKDVSAEINRLSKTTKLKYIIITHSHLDHAGALNHVYHSLPNPKPIVYFNRPQEKTCLLERAWADGAGVGCDDYDKYIQGIPIQNLNEGDKLKVGNFDFDVLAASYSGSIDHNDESIVMMMKHKPSGHTMLHTGDANIRAGQYLVDNYNLKTDVLVLPHHGCKGQPNDNFYREANPYIAIWQTTARALNGRYDICGHTYELLKSIGVPDSRQLWQWKPHNNTNSRIDFPITDENVEMLPRRNKAITHIINLLLLGD